MNPGWLEADWPAPPGVRVLSTFRFAAGEDGGASAPPYAGFNLGDHVGDDPEAVVSNRDNLLRAAGLPGAPAWLKQVHGNTVADLDSSAPPAVADGSITRRANQVCAILTADCLPILFAAQNGAAIGAAHAGWRGLSAGVIEATVQALALPPLQILVWLGPAIGPRHFEVGAEVRAAFLQADPKSDAAFEPNSRGRFMADLFMLARLRLQALGIERIYGGGECTYARADRYFSYRRDGTTGRQATLIWRQN